MVSICILFVVMFLSCKERGGGTKEGIKDFTSIIKEGSAFRSCEERVAEATPTKQSYKAGLFSSRLFIQFFIDIYCSSFHAKTI